MFGIFSALGIGLNLVNDARIHNQKYFGTERDIYRNNPEVQRNRKACEDIFETTRLERFFGVQRPLNKFPDEWLAELKEMESEYMRRTGRSIPR